MQDIDDHVQRRQSDQRGTGWRPVPDPTELTTRQLHREIGILQEIIETRLGSIDELMDEKFKGVESTFALIERQRVESKDDSTKALEAALVAQKDAVKKTEDQTGKQIDSFVNRFGTVLDDVRSEIAVVNGRITVIEAIKIGGNEVRTESRLTVGVVIAAVSVIVAVMGICVAIILASLPS